MKKDNYKNNLIIGETLKTLKSLPDNLIDLGITSPPYNKQEKNNGGLVKHVIYSDFKDAMPENKYQDNQIEVLNEIYRITKDGGSFFYNHKTRWDNGEMYHPMDWLRKTNWVVKQEIIWDRTIAANIRGWRFWQTEERIYWLYKPINKDKKGKELASCDAKLTSIWRAVPENNNSHPAPFPLWLPARIIISLLRDKKDCLVLDPYMGSGTTAVAAKLLGHNYLGIDISKEYLSLAENRIKNSEKEKEKIDKELSGHIVEKTYSQRKIEKAEKKLKLENIFIQSNIFEINDKNFTKKKSIKNFTKKNISKNK